MFWLKGSNTNAEAATRASLSAAFLKTHGVSQREASRGEALQDAAEEN